MSRIRSEYEIRKDIKQIRMQLNAFMRGKHEFSPQGRRDYLQRLRKQLLNLAIELKNSRAAAPQGDIYARMEKLRDRYRMREDEARIGGRL